MMEPVIPYGKQHITPEDIEAVANALASDYLTQGPKVTEFEEAFAEYIGCKYAVAVSNGTAALHLCALALEVDFSSNVITTAITFAASANCIRYCNGNVYFADIDPNTICLDLEKVRELIQSQPAGFFKGIVVVDFAGYPVNMELFRNLANEYGLWLVEDACHAPGAFYIDSKGKKQKSGNCIHADLAIFSFHPVKHIACGEGGMVTTNDKALYEKLQLYRTHGITKNPEQLSKIDGGWYYEMQVLGFNYRLTDFQSALGLSQLKRAEEGLKRRREIAADYFNAFNGNPDIIWQSGIAEGHAYHLYIIQVNRRMELYEFLKANRIICQVHYIPVSSMPYYRDLSSEQVQPEHAQSYYDKCLSLPMYPTLTKLEQDYVICKINEFFNK